MQIFLTGGTLDKHYNELNGELVFTQTHMDQMLKEARLSVEHSLDVLMLKDSLEMTDADRSLIAKACLDCSDNTIVIAHGTDTMVETGMAIAEALAGEAGSGKRIVLFGAMLPFELKGSDALFNLGTAVAAVQLVSPGVYVAMNGRIFAHDQVKKNRAAGRFEQA